MNKHNNYIFKRTLALFGLFDKNEVIHVFQTVNYNVSKSQIDKWRKINNDNKVSMPNEALQAFFDGLLALSERNEINVYLNLIQDIDFE